MNYGFEYQRPSSAVMKQYVGVIGMKTLIKYSQSILIGQLRTVYPKKTKLLELLWASKDYPYNGFLWVSKIKRPFNIAIST